MTIRQQLSILQGQAEQRNEQLSVPEQRANRLVIDALTDLKAFITDERVDAFVAISSIIKVLTCRQAYFVGSALALLQQTSEQLGNIA